MVRRVADRLLAVDSNSLSAWMEGEGAIQSQLPGSVPALPAPVLQEACYGWILAILKAEQRSREDLIGRYLQWLAELVEFSQPLTILRYTDQAQALYRSLTPGRGNRGRNDLRIAAVCLAHNAPLLTRNVGDFQDIPGLELRTW